MLDAELNVCYWSLLSDRYSKIDKACRAIVAINASTTVAAWGFWAGLPYIWKTLSAIACLVSLLGPIIWPADQLKRMNNLVGSWRQVAFDYENLWNRDDELETPGAWKAFEKTREHQSKIDETRLPFSEKLRSKAQREVLKRRGF
jgi:hypothetical protein